MIKHGLKISTFFAMAIGLLLFAPGPVFAQMGQLYEDYGVGIRDAAMGNCGTACSNDYSAAFYNPAALVRAEGLSIDLGYKGVYPNLFMKIGNFSDKKFTKYPTTNFFLVGISWDMIAEKLIDKKFTDRFYLGFTAAVSDYYKSFSIYYDRDTPYFYRYHDRYLNLLPIYLSMAVRLFDWVSIGAGLVPAPTDAYTDVAVDSHFTVPDYEYNAEQGTTVRAYAKIEPVAGILFRIPNEKMADYCSIGFVWRDEVTSMDGQGKATDYTKVHFGDNIIELPPSDTPILTLSGWTPMQVVGAIALHPSIHSTITVEELWKRWSNWKNFFAESPTPGFNDTWNTRFGAENIFPVKTGPLEDIAARIGIYRELSPVPDQNGQSNYLDPNKWVITTGIETKWVSQKDIFRVPIHAGIAGQAHIMDKIHLSNDRDPDYPAIDAWGEVYSITATVGVGIR